jgi:hypothetical protein
VTELNEAGLQAAAAEMGDDDGEGYHDRAAGVIQAYFEHAEVDTKKRLHPTDRSKHLSGHTVKFVVGGVEGYLTMNDFYDGSPGEIFLHGIGKEGSTVSGLLDLVAILISVALQYGVPLKQITKFMKGMNFEPKDEYFTSIPDLLANYLEERYGEK